MILLKNNIKITWPIINFCYKESGLQDTLFPKDANDVTIEGNGSYVETWKAMEKLVQKGLTKSIGLSNFNKRQTEDILKVATIKPVTNQVNKWTIYKIFITLSFNERLFDF